MFVFTLPKTREAVKHLSCVWWKTLHQMLLFAGLDDQGRLRLLPYGFIFQLNQWPEGYNGFIITV